MPKRARFQLRLALSLGLVLGTGGATDAVAGFVYGYAEQTLTGITVSGAGLSNATPTGSSTSAAATVTGVGVSTNDSTDTLQAYQGASPPAPQNDYTKYSTAGGGPQAGDFARGDAVITNALNIFAGGASASNVAESFLSTGGGSSLGPGLMTSSGSWSLSGTFMSPTTSSVMVSYSFANDILTEIAGTGVGPAQASFQAVFSIKDQHGHEVDSSPTELNTAFSSPPNGPEVITSGTGSVNFSLAALTAGDTYTISLSGTELSSATIAASVPEPSSLVMSATAALSGLVLAMRRRARVAA